MTDRKIDARSGFTRWCALILATSATLFSAASYAVIDGITGPSFTLTASEGYISIPDGASVYSWGYSANGAPMQLPGPTLIVNVGDLVTIDLTNGLPAAAGNVSIVFPGHQVQATAGTGVPGALTQEAIPGGSVSYSFTATTPGTYQYHSGTQQDLQVEMGLYGAIIVRPDLGLSFAYDNPNTDFDREYLFLVSEVDLDIHQAAELAANGPGPIVIPTGTYDPEYWLLNGRAAPDTMAPPNIAQLPHQPYNVLPKMNPGEKLLLRVVGAGRQMHPFHTHGNHAQVLARDGNLLLSASGSTLAGPELFTIPTLPGGTVDAMFEWTGQDLGWDIYGHAQDLDNVPLGNFPGAEDIDHNGDGILDTVALEPDEWAPDHGKPLPVELPNLTSLAFGGFYSGSPFLGSLGALPPGEGGLNPNSGFAYMWHSHHGKEQVNNDVFPGGIMTMLIVEALCLAGDPNCTPIP